jgi:multicomponent Na+:H+ antiporter subunit D
MPWTGVAFALGGLGLIGVPATAGFVSKWYLVLAVLETGQLWLAVLILLSSLLAVVYVWRVIEVLFFQEPDAEFRETREAPLSLLIPSYAFVLFSIVIGLHAELPVDAAQTAAHELFTSGPQSAALERGQPMALGGAR